MSLELVLPVLRWPTFIAKKAAKRNLLRSIQYLVLTISLLNCQMVRQMAHNKNVRFMHIALRHVRGDAVQASRSDTQ